MIHTRTEQLVSGNFRYGAVVGPPSVDTRTNEPVGQVTLLFQDNDPPNSTVQVMLGDDAARDLAMKILDVLKQGTLPQIHIPR